MSDADWAGYDSCAKCSALPAEPCLDNLGAVRLAAHVGRRYFSALDPDRPRSSDDGDMMRAVKADLAGLDLSKVPGGQTYRTMALWLASVIDKRGSEDGPSVTAKLADQLGKTMAVLTRKGDESGPTFEDISASLSIPGS